MTWLLMAACSPINRFAMALSPASCVVSTETVWRRISSTITITSLTSLAWLSLPSQTFTSPCLNILNLSTSLFLIARTCSSIVVYIGNLETSPCRMVVVKIFSTSELKYFLMDLNKMNVILYNVYIKVYKYIQVICLTCLSVWPSLLMELFTSDISSRSSFTPWPQNIQHQARYNWGFVLLMRKQESIWTDFVIWTSCEFREHWNRTELYCQTKNAKKNHWIS